MGALGHRGERPGPRLVELGTRAARDDIGDAALVADSGLERPGPLVVMIMAVHDQGHVMLLEDRTPGRPKLLGPPMKPRGRPRRPMVKHDLPGSALCRSQVSCQC